MSRRTPENDIDRYLATGEHDVQFTAWPGSNLLESTRLGDAELRAALEAEICARELRVTRTTELPNVDVVSLTRSKVEPMVCGLFPRVEQPIVLALLEHSVVFLTPASIRHIIHSHTWLRTIWTLADAYLDDIGAERLADDHPALVGLSEDTTCYVTSAYLNSPEPFSDYIVHEVAHVFHNCKRETVGLPATRSREWLLDVDFRMRETFAYACEAYSYLLAHTNGRADRRRLLAELAAGYVPSDERVNGEEYLDILAAAIESRAGWKRILSRCRRPT